MNKEEIIADQMRIVKKYFPKVKKCLENHSITKILNVPGGTEYWCGDCDVLLFEEHTWGNSS